MAWSYKREETNNNFVTKIPEGKHRVRVKSAEKAVSKTGNDMIVLQFDVSGFSDTIYYYIVFMNDRPEITNGKLTQFFDSFKDIPDGDFNMQNWIGKVGAACIKHEEYNGNTNAKISWFVRADKQDDLPAWQEVSTPKPAGALPDTGGAFAPAPQGVEIPFI